MMSGNTGSTPVRLRGAARAFLALCGMLILASARPATAAELDYPIAVAADAEGRVYLADRYLPGIWTVEGESLKLFFEGSKKFRTPLNAIRTLAFDREGRLLAGDSSTREVYRFDAQGQPQPLTQGGIGIPMGIAVNRAGEIFVSDLEVHYLWKIPAEGGPPQKFAEVAAPRGLTIDADDRLWVVSHGQNQVVRVSPAGVVEPFVKGRPFKFPHGLVLGPDGTSLVVDGYAKAVWKVDAQGAVSEWVHGQPLANPVGLTWSKDQLVVADSQAKGLWRIDPAGKVTPLVIKAPE